MSEFRVEKHRAAADLTLSTGARVKGVFFLSDSSAARAGAERVCDLLNGEAGFFPFELAGEGQARTVMYNRAHIAMVALPANALEARLDIGYDLAVKRRVALLLTTGMRVTGTVAIYQPDGHTRLSDYTRVEEVFRYLETADHTLIINFAHVVELLETPE
jgi:hypothetical protein